MIVRSAGLLSLRFLWRHSVHSFADPEAALQFLAPFKDNPAGMAELRRLLSERSILEDPERAPDARVLAAVAGLLTSGELLAGFEWKEHLPAASGEAAAEPAASSAQAPAPERRQEEEADTFSAASDGGAQVAALLSAAESGVPFCEECERARQAEAAGGGQ